MKKLLIIFILILSCSFASASLFESDPDLVLYYELDENITLRNNATNFKNQFNFTYDGITPQQPTEAPNSVYAIDFDGGDKAINENATLQTVINSLNKSGFSVDFWIHVTIGANGAVFGFGDNSIEGFYGQTLTSGSDNFFFRFHDNDKCKITISTEWHHITMTSNTSHITTWLDGSKNQLRTHFC